MGSIERAVLGMAIVGCFTVMAMIAVDDVGRHELVEKSRNSLDAQEAQGEEEHHDQASSLIRPTLLLKVILGLG